MTMTNKQYIAKTLSSLNVSDDDVDIILLKSSLNAEAQVDVSACDLAIYRRISLILKGVTQNTTEGGYTLSWNIEAVKLYYNALCNELGVENALVGRPKIRNRSNVW